MEISLQEYDTLLEVGEAACKLLIEISPAVRALQDAVLAWDEVAGKLARAEGMNPLAVNNV